MEMWVKNDRVDALIVGLSMSGQIVVISGGKTIASKVELPSCVRRMALSK
jgi:hypothetical protein